MTDAPAFHDYAQKALVEVMQNATNTLVAGNFPDFAAYKQAVGVCKGIQLAAESLRHTYKTVIENVKAPKDDNAGRKPEDHKW